MARSTARSGRTETYRHPGSEMALRPEVGTQPQFRKRKPPVTYRYDSSLAPALDWDGKHSAREHGEWLLALIDEASRLPPPHEFAGPRELRGADGRVLANCRGLHDAVAQLKRLGRPFLDWAGKAERLSFDVPTLPLFVHERLSTMAIVETLKGHTREALGPQLGMFEMFGDPRHPLADQVLKAYEYRDKWVNRMILGDSLVLMNSLLHYEGLGGQVQMIYVDPPYGVKFGSNFQPFVRKRDVTHNDDSDMTREPEMVKAYRDTWELGLHSYLTYLRDRLLLARDLLHLSGSVFVQISDENLHHVRELMDEVFGEKNFCGVIAFRTTSSQTDELVATIADFILWYAKDRDSVKFRRLFRPREAGEGLYEWVEMPGDKVEPLGDRKRDELPPDARLFTRDNLTSARPPGSFPFRFGDRDYTPGKSYWKTSYDGLEHLAKAGRLVSHGNGLYYKRYFDDFPFVSLTNIWNDTQSGGTFAGREPKIYAVQTNPRVIQRCLLMTTDPGDLVFDPTCGAGTTAYVAEQWGRRWITVDTSRVPLALSRQRVLTATFPYYRLKDEARGPAAGFFYQRRQSRKGEEIGGVVPHVMLKNIANNESDTEELIVDRPEADGKITRVSGPFCVEATIPMPVDWEGGGSEGGDGAEDYGSYLDRMIEVLRRAPVLQLGGGQSVTLRNVRPPAKSLALSAEAVVDAPGGAAVLLGDAVAGGSPPPLPSPIEGEGEGRGPSPIEGDGERRGRSPIRGEGAGLPVALVLGPENGAVSERLVAEAAREAHGKNYAHLYVVGFAIQPNARALVEQCEAVFGVSATYVQATPDLMMGDLLKTMRSSQIFSVCGMPDVRLRKLPPAMAGEPGRYEVELLGLDVFDPATMQPDHLNGGDVPAWLLDTDYNGLVFHGNQVFFPRTGAWEHLKKALKATHDESVWDHLAGTTSAPFDGGEHRQVAVKVIDDRGNELIVVKLLDEAG